MQSFTSLPRCFLMLIATFALCSATLYGEDPVFSGPQVGEKLPPFEVRGVLGEDAGATIDFVNDADGKPIVLIFIHQATRPSIGFARMLSSYTRSRADDGLITGIVWLDDDATAAENTVKRVQHALTSGVRVGVSADGQEGPGSYGLNRNVMLTILVGKESKVTANFALIQPSVQADLPKVLKEIVNVVGGQVPKLTDIPGASQELRMQTDDQPDLQLRTLLRAVIDRGASPEQVDKAALAVEEYAAKYEAAAKEVGRIANTIVNSDRIANYGSPRAQEVLRRWARSFGSQEKQSEGSPEDKNGPSSKSSPGTKGSSASGSSSSSASGESK